MWTSTLSYPSNTTTLAAFDSSLAALWGESGDSVERPGFGANATWSFPQSAPWSSERAYGHGGENPASVFWRGLTGGDLVLVDTFPADSLCVAIARERFNASNALTDRELVLLERAFQAEQQKNLAFGLDVSMSTVSQVIGGALIKLGLSRRVRSTPLAVVLAALNHRGVIDMPFVRFAAFQTGEQRHVAIGFPHLNKAMLGELTVAEREVALLLASTGASTAQIAAQRGTSASTVSNQIASLCAKLRVHGRFELILRWAELQWGLSAAAE
jgi:DNA-binding NarL/FixJ family response regulator